MRSFLTGFVGLAVGSIAGLVVTMGLVVARARIEGVYVAEALDLVGWVGAPLVLGPVLGAWIGAWGPAARSILPGSVLGLLAGLALGWVGGSLVADDPAAPWAGMLMGGAAGLVLGAWTPLLGHVRRVRRARELGIDPGPRRSVLATVLITALALVPIAAVASRSLDSGPLPESVIRPEPDPSRVAAVVLLAGDAGEARAGTHPILPRLRSEVERWAGSLGRDSAVVVLWLGDVVYPDGLSEPGSAGWASDSAVVADQAAVVAGPAASDRGARAFFLAGNHDWDGRAAGAARLVRLGELLDRLRAAGPAVSLRPTAGSGGPAVVDVGDALRLVLLDTAWWLVEGEEPARDAVMDGVASAMAAAEGRAVVIAAHHPFDSAGPHGGLAELGRTFGIRALLARSGALLQDLHSRPYAALRARLLGVFARYGEPDLFAGGHEHSMQLLRGGGQASFPTVVSGAASKLTGVGGAPGLLFARAEPGFARLLVLEDGGLHLTIETAPADYLSCPGSEPERSACMGAAASAFRVVWSRAL